MTGWILQLILGVALFFSSSLSGMAKEAVSAKSQPDFFEAGEVDEDEASYRLIIDSEDSGRSSRLAQGQRRKPAAEGVRARGESKQMLLVFSDEGMLPSFSVEEQSESSVESETEQKRTQKRASSPKKFLSKCRLINFLSLEALAKGVARHPLTQDARQERTEMIRFLQIAALVC